METSTLILQILVSIVSQQEGAVEFLKIEDKSALVEITPTQPLALKILNYSWTNASMFLTEIPEVQRSINATIPQLLVAFKNTDAVTLIDSIGSLLPHLGAEVCPILVWSVVHLLTNTNR